MNILESVKRYDIVYGEKSQENDGEWVKYADYEKLEAFAKAIAEQSLNSRWISVDTALPELNGSFLVYLSNSGVNRKVYRMKTGWTMKKIERALHDNVTHWQPLLEPPKD